MEGLEIWRNPKNGFIVFQLHYTANPLKRSEEWKQKTSSNLTRARFMQEYEITWETWEGKPVYPDFAKKIHSTTRELEPERGLPLLRGWDFGLTPACIVGQLQGRQLVVLKEFVSVNMGIDRFSREIVIPGCAIEFPAWGDPRKDWIDFIDPAGLSKNQVNEVTCAQQMTKNGIKRIFPGVIDWEGRRSAVERLLTTYFRRGNEVHPAVIISQSGCPDLVQGFLGGYRYPDKAIEVEPDKIKPIKNRYSHIHDGFQYLASRASSLIRPGSGAGNDIPIPGYRLGG